MKLFLYFSKTWHSKTPYLVACLAFVILQACSPAPESDSQIGEKSNHSKEGKTVIYSVNNPLKYMADRLVDTSWAEVRFPATAEVADPAFWKPSNAIIEQYQQADIILLNGAGYAQWIDSVSLPQSRLVDTASGFQDQLILNEDAVTHQHGPEGEHTHGGFAAMTWLDFNLASKQARAVFEALMEKAPAHLEMLTTNHTQLQEDLDNLHVLMQKAQSSIGQTRLLASHPVYQYLARAYQLNLHSLHWEPDETPKESEWNALDTYLKQSPTRHMLWEDTPTPETQTKLAERNIKWVVFRPQGGTPASGDFLSVMRQNIEALSSAFDEF